MPKAEFLQTAAQFAGQARELFDAGARTNLLQNLTQAGHPYGLLLGQSSGSSESSINFFFPPEKGQAKVAFNGLGPAPIQKHLEGLVCSILLPSFWPSLSFQSSAQAAPSIGPFSMAAIVNSELVNISSGIETSLRRGFSEGVETTFNRVLAVSGKWGTNSNEKSLAGLITTIFSKGSILGSAKSNPDSARKIHMEGLTQQAFLAPIFLKLFVREKPAERPRELKVGKHSVSLGTTAIKLATYNGEQPFIVRTPQGEPIVQINPGDQLGHLHVSHQAGLMRGLSPLEKAEQITGDFMDLFRAVDSGAPNLNAKQQEVLAKAQNATLIGISHLVRLFRHRTGLPTWKIDVLPELVQKFHQHDSQAVSKAFGGTRKVRVSDVEMMIVTPAMRQALATQFP